MHTSPNLATIPHFRHGFFGREGGVSGGLYASLNVGYGSGDDPEKITENRRRVCEALGAKTLLTCFQVHGARVMTVREPWEWKDSPEADAMVTDRPGIALGILTADCLPVLFTDRKKPIIGAAHSGWKSATLGILEATVQAMHELGAEDIIAAIGPAIAQESYEVGPEFHARFIAENPANAAFFKPSARAGHHYFDLPAYAKARLLCAGIAQTEVLAYDTCSLEQQFFSYRRATLRGESVYGRQVAGIVIK